MKQGIDISRWQGSDFIIKDTQFVILKIGGADDGLYEDSLFRKYYKQAKRDNIPVGAYFFGNAKTIDDANNEADYLLSLLKDLTFEYPIYYDVEGSMLNVEKQLLTDIIITVMEKLEDNGYYAGIYTSVSHFNNNVDDMRLVPYTHWVAYYDSIKPVLKSDAEVDIWQYSSSKTIQGRKVDHNFCYVDFPTIIKEDKFNNYGKEEKSKKSNEGIADEVMKGLWGDNPERKMKLIQAGYDYDAIQSIVDRKYYDNELRVGDIVTLGSIGTKVRDVNGIDCTIWYDTYTITELYDDTVVVSKERIVFGRFYKNQVKKV